MEIIGMHKCCTLLPAEKNRLTTSSLFTLLCISLPRPSQ